MMELTLDQMDKVSGGILVEQSEDYYAQKYCAVGNDTTEQQLRDYLFIAEGE